MVAAAAVNAAFIILSAAKNLLHLASQLCGRQCRLKVLRCAYNDVYATY